MIPSGVHGILVITILVLTTGCTSFNQVHTTAVPSQPTENKTCVMAIAGQMADRSGCFVRNEGIFSDYPIYFASKSTEILMAESFTLPEILDIAKRMVTDRRQATIELTGYSDLCTDLPKSIELSAKRIQVVEQYLATHGIAQSDITKRVSLGNSAPIVSTPNSGPDCAVKANNQVSVRFRSVNQRN